VVEAGAEELPQNLESDWGRQQDDDPLNLEPAHEPPHLPVKVGEEERREVPDRFLRADFTQAAAGESAPDREGQRDPFAGDRRRDADHRPDDRAGVRTGEETREKRAGQGEVGGLVVEQQTRDDARRQRKAEAGGEDQTLRPVTLLRQQDSAKPRKPHQHRRENRDDRQLHHQRRQQILIGRQELGFVRHWSGLEARNCVSIAFSVRCRANPQPPRTTSAIQVFMLETALRQPKSAVALL
jgi:hypothetical protein